ncbi:MAG: M3 family oligoendopeptidase [Candidatus Vogelbacteria bacterium]|nr:M3 family oligoendopeptidase [Candidatus Vogelbacteria bacterium]
MTAKNKWNLTPLYKGDTDPKLKSDLAKIKTAGLMLAARWRGHNDWLADPKILRQALDEYETWARELSTSGKAGFYLSLRLAQDENNNQLKALKTKVRDVAMVVGNELEFFTNRLSKLDRDEQERLLMAGELKPYRHFLERLFATGQYTLSEPEEKILTLKSAGSHERWVDMTSSFLAAESAVVLTPKGQKTRQPLSVISSLTSHRKKAVRDSAAVAFNQIIMRQALVAEHELNALLEDKKVNDELRGFKRPDAGRHLGDDIETATVDALLKAVSANFEIAQRYYKLKAKLLGVKKLKYYERNLPINRTTTTYHWSAAIKLVAQSLTQLDPEFGAIVKQFLDQGRFDVYPRSGKSSGAFCASNLLAQPVYVMLNHTNELRDVLTLAHEMGHAINYELMRKNCHALDFDTSLATAEVASTFMEDFVLERLIHKVGQRERLVLIMAKLNDDVSSIFRQVACYLFEQELHATYRLKGYLSKEEIGQIFKKHMRAYMGPAVEQTVGMAENWWVYWSHIRNHFYVYSYASGLLISKALQAKLRQDERFMEQIKEFLSAGMSASPETLFNRMRVDITDPKTWTQGLKEVELLLVEAENLTKKLDKK